MPINCSTSRVDPDVTSTIPWTFGVSDASSLKVSSELDGEETNKVKALIRQFLQYDPAKRLSAAELLADPWFREFEV
ncbi:hypothetical protein B0J13DRAFT_571680 [Dactylonectria estremocensis]|uniref:Protein kinase domain-containing protein n=1 Tax=Dactylonectria estremocensis TaxID=1079267 RepID=A0A9P9DCD5_9HYPO|nr:hypothetical protein B0J13DRAFT_571680 [Dactylonectria estremocensis]